MRVGAENLGWRVKRGSPHRGPPARNPVGPYGPSHLSDSRLARSGTTDAVAEEHLLKNAPSSERRLSLPCRNGESDLEAGDSPAHSLVPLPIHLSTLLTNTYHRPSKGTQLSHQVTHPPTSRSHRRPSCHLATGPPVDSPASSTGCPSTHLAFTCPLSCPSVHVLMYLHIRPLPQTPSARPEAISGHKARLAGINSGCCSQNQVGSKQTLCHWLCGFPSSHTCTSSPGKKSKAWRVGKRGLWVSAIY